MERGISSARDFVIEPLAKAILVAQLAAALGATWSSPSRRLTPSAVAMVPLAACARLGVDGSHEPHRQAKGK
jgi:hypothetical protein